MFSPAPIFVAPGHGAEGPWQQVNLLNARWPDHPPPAICYLLTVILLIPMYPNPQSIASNICSATRIDIPVYPA